MSTKLFVGNISWDATEADIKAAFEEAGFVVVEVKLIMDRERDGRHKGFGFVTLDTEENAQKAMEEMNGKEIAGREIFIDEAREQKPRD